jgi:hypothetical protein
MHDILKVHARKKRWWSKFDRVFCGGQLYFVLMLGLLAGHQATPYSYGARVLKSTTISLNISIRLHSEDKSRDD